LGQPRAFFRFFGPPDAADFDRFCPRPGNRKRGHRSPHVSLSAAGHVAANESDPISLLDPDHAPDELAQLDERQAKLVELRYFGGLENAEIAAVLGISEPTVVRDWRLARAWLFGRLRLE